MPKGNPAGYLPKARKGGKKMKRKKGAVNPFALANLAMKKQGK